MLSIKVGHELSIAIGQQTHSNAKRGNGLTNVNHLVDAKVGCPTVPGTDSHETKRGRQVESISQTQIGQHVVLVVRSIGCWNKTSQQDSMSDAAKHPIVSLLQQQRAIRKAFAAAGV
jgi:hypothetical protein